MIDLHLHFDGSLPDEVIYELAKRENICLPEDEKERARMLHVCGSCTDLNEYLEKFDLPLALLQTRENIEYASEKFFESILKELLYAEVRFAPASFTGKGLSQEEALEAVIAGLNKAAARAESVHGWKRKANLILCCMRGNSAKTNLETVELCSRYKDKGVVAADLAGAEALFPTADYKDIFKKAKELGVRFTIHAGEAAGADSIIQALDMGASRIGHGIRAYENEELTQRLIKEQIPLECCPKSNMDTKAVPKNMIYPLKKYLDMGMCITVNTDNMSVSDTSLNKEFELLKDMLGITHEDRKVLLENSIRAAFLDITEKEILNKVMSEN